jgi:hypothetical protein
MSQRLGPALAGAFFCVLALPVAGQEVCGRVAAGLGRLDLSAAQDLKASALGRTYKSLFDECDTRNTFAGRPLPGGNRCSTDRNRVEFLKKFPDGTIVFRAKAAVDADGSPAASGPCASSADQSETSLTFDDGPTANAEEIPFVVVPLRASGRNVSFPADSRIKVGDLAVAVRESKCSLGLVGDEGPFFRLGEASVRTHLELGNEQCTVPGQHPCRCLRAGGDGVGIGSGVTYIIFPRTRPGGLTSRNAAQVARQAAEAKVTRFLAAFQH